MREFRKCSTCSLFFSAICPQTSILHLRCRSVEYECIILLYFPRIFFGFTVQALRVSNHGTLYTLTI